MTEIQTQLTIRRVLVALDTGRDDARTLDTAARLAAKRDIELVALFIEDQDLLQLAEFPFASEINRSSGAERKLDSRQISRILRNEAQRISRYLENMTRELRLKYSLKIIRGHYTMEAVAATVETDILFMQRDIGKHRLGPVFSATGTVTGKTIPITGHPGIVRALYSGSPGSDTALTVAAEIAATCNRRLEILQQNKTDIPSYLRQKLEDWPGLPAYTVMPGMDIMDMQKKMTSLHGNRNCLLVLHADDVEDRDQLTTGLLEELNCPVAIVF